MSIVLIVPVSVLFGMLLVRMVRIFEEPENEYGFYATAMLLALPLIYIMQPQIDSLPWPTFLVLNAIFFAGLFFGSYAEDEENLLKFLSD